MTPEEACDFNEGWDRYKEGPGQVAIETFVGVFGLMAVLGSVLVALNRGPK